MILNHHHILCVEVRGVKEVPIKRTIVNCIIKKFGGVCIKTHPSSDPNLPFASLVPHLPYSENASRLRAFVPGTGARPVGMGLPRAAWVNLNRLRTGVGRFHSSMHKWGLAPSPNCECVASEQTADHVLTACLIHRAPHGARGLTVLDEETRCWLNDITASV